MGVTGRQTHQGDYPAERHCPDGEDLLPNSAPAPAIKAIVHRSHTGRIPVDNSANDILSLTHG
jgi:hypothetical protein